MLFDNENIITFGTRFETIMILVNIYEGFILGIISNTISI